MGTVRKPGAKAREPDRGSDRRRKSARRDFPPEAYVFHDEVDKEAVESIQRRADAELAGDELVVIEGDGDDA